MTLPINVPRPTPLLFLDLDGTVRQGKDDPLGRASVQRDDWAWREHLGSVDNAVPSAVIREGESA